MNLDRRLLALARKARFWLALTLLAGVAGGVLLVGQARALSAAVSGAFLQGRALADIAPLLLALVAAALGRAVCTWLGSAAGYEAAARVKGDLRERLFAHLLALGPAHVGGERSGELVSALTDGVDALDDYFGQYLPQIALAALVPLTYLLFLFPADPLSAVILLVTAPLIPLFMVLIGAAARRLTRQQWALLSRMSAHFLDVLQGLTTLRLFGRSRRQIAVIARIGDQWRGTTLGVLRVAFLSALALELIATLSTAVVAVEIGLRLLYGGIVFEQALFVLVLAPEFYLPLRALGVRFHAGMGGVAAAERLFAILETPLPPRPEKSAPPPARMHITFAGVRCAYGGERAALDGVSFAIEPGQQVALVGPSGAGKSTIAALLLRFMTAEEGEIRVDGVPLGELDPDGWRARLAWVPQRPYLFHASALENIRLGRPQAGPDEVRWAARQAGADAFIAALPDGYDTIIGERGARLSGGQGQRIALARAFLRDAPLLILDEATANLDPESERLVTDAVRRLARNCTSLIIAHRLSTVAGADRIIVLAGGRVAESGTHADLLATGGLYARLVAAGSPDGTEEPDARSDS